METQLADVIRVDCRHPEAAQQACAAIEGHGYTVLDHLLDPAKAAALLREFVERHPRYLEDVEHSETVRLSHRRYLVPVAFAGDFADPEVYGHPMVLAIIRQLLGPDAILEAFGAVVSLGLAVPQHLHRDGPLLFDTAEASHLPCHALTFSIPMIAFDDRVGTTAFWPGSHRRSVPPNVLDPNDRPELPLGSAVLWDFRIWHRGEANFTETARPMVYATYSRVWFRDPTSFHRTGQMRMNLDDSFLRNVPDDRRSLFSHLVAAR